MNTQRGQWWWIIPVLIGLGAGLIWAQFRLLTAGGLYANRDYMSLWSGGRAILEGLDPYDPGTWASIRSRYGSTWMPDARAPFPLWTLVLHIPFSALSLDWGAAAWLAASEVMLGVSLLLALFAARARRPSVAEYAGIAVSALVARSSLVTLANGQITFVLLLAITTFLVWTKGNKPFWAGAALALTALKPSPFVVFVPLLGLWSLSRGRWRTVAGGLSSGLALLVGSVALRPGWLPTWLGVAGKTQVAFATPTVWGAAFELSHQWWPLVGLGLAVLVTALAGWRLLTDHDMGEAHVVALALSASLLVTPYAWAYEHALLLLPLVFLFASVQDRRIAWCAWLGFVLVGPWFLYWLACLIGRDSVSMLLPLAVGLVFWPKGATRSLAGRPHVMDRTVADSQLGRQIEVRKKR